VALPGFLDEARERVLRLSNVPALDGVPLRARLERRLGLPVTLDTDTNAGALAEALLGAGRGFERVLYLTLGTGLGVAFVVGWRPVRVSHHTVGQAAHVPLRPRGTRCRCGERGCAEAELSAGGILRRARARGLRGLASTHELWELAGRRGAGSALKAREVWRETGRLLGLLCVTLGAIVDPDAIVIGGGVAAAAEQLLPVLEREIRDHLTPRLGRPVALRPAALGHLAGAVGAALLGARPA
jgi:glucokinase